MRRKRKKVTLFRRRRNYGKKTSGQPCQASCAHEGQNFVSWLPNPRFFLYEMKTLVSVFCKTKLPYIADRTTTYPIITTIRCVGHKSKGFLAIRFVENNILVILPIRGLSPTLVPCWCAWYHNFVFYETNVFIFWFLHNEIYA
jgi:hypothetical protein